MQYGIKYTISFPRLDKRIFPLFLCSVSMNRDYFPKIVSVQNLRLTSSKRHLCFFHYLGISVQTSHFNIPPRCSICTNYGKIPRSGQHYSILTGIYISSATNYITLLLVPCYFQCHVSRIILVGRKIPSHMNWADPKKDHLIRDKACERGFVLMIVSSLCRIHSESLHGFCHFHLNCSNH